MVGFRFLAALEMRFLAAFEMTPKGVRCGMTNREEIATVVALPAMTDRGGKRDLLLILAFPTSKVFGQRSGVFF